MFGRATTSPLRSTRRLLTLSLPDNNCCLHFDCKRQATTAANTFSSLGRQLHEYAASRYMAGVGGSRLTELRRDGQLQQKPPLTENERSSRTTNRFYRLLCDGVIFASTNQIIRRVSLAARGRGESDAHAHSKQ